MRAARIHAFGGPDVIVIEEVPTPVPSGRDVLVRVHAAGVGPWDGWIRAGKSVLPQPLPLTLGSDLAGTVVGIGRDVHELAVGDDVFGVTNERFTGAYAELALASASRLAKRPGGTTFVEAAALPVVAVTAWQMLFDHAGVAAGNVVVVHGAAGNVGRIAVRLARHAGARVIGSGRAEQLDAIREAGAHDAFTLDSPQWRVVSGEVDAVIDTVGSEAQRVSLPLLRRGGILVSAVAEPDAAEADRRGIRATFILVDVTATALARIAALIGPAGLTPRIAAVLPLGAARRAHEMLEGTRPHGEGKIVLEVAHPA